MSNLLINGVDADLIFEPRGVSAARANVNILENGVDIAQNYYDLSLGGDAPSITNALANGSDLNTIFAALGSVAYNTITWSSEPPVSYSSSDTSVATAGITLNSDGTTTRTADSGTLAGDWLKNTGANAGDIFECRMTGGDVGLISGTGSTSWQLVDTARSFNLTGASSELALFDIEIRPVGGSSESRLISLDIDITGVPE